MAADFRRNSSWRVTLKTLGKTLPLFLLLLCLCAPEEKDKGMTELAKCIQSSEFVVHGRVDTFGTGMDGSLPRIGFHVREVLKGTYTEAKVEFEELPPAISGGVKPFDLFRDHGNDYIICFKKGAKKGRYEYSGPNLNSQTIIANGANVQKAKEIISGKTVVTWFDTALPWWSLFCAGFVLLAATAVVVVTQVLHNRRPKVKV